MKPERWQEIEVLFHSALKCPPDERAALLDKACGDDAELRHQVEALVSSLEEAGDFIEYAPLAGALSSVVEDSTDKSTKQNADAPSNLIGHRIANYEIQSLLGVGGMGEVYLARDVRLDRWIAVKILPT